MFSIFFYAFFSLSLPLRDLPLRHFSTSEFSASCFANFTFKIYICVENFSVRLSVSYFIYISILFWILLAFLPRFSPAAHLRHSEKGRTPTRKKFIHFENFFLFTSPFLNMTFLGIIIGLTFTAALQQVSTNLHFWNIYSSNHYSFLLPSD